MRAAAFDYASRMSAYDPQETHELPCGGRGLGDGSRGLQYRRQRSSLPVLEQTVAWRFEAHKPGLPARRLGGTLLCKPLMALSGHASRRV
jgi:hypothetical protein